MRTLLGLAALLLAAAPPAAAATPCDGPVCVPAPGATVEPTQRFLDEEADEAVRVTTRYAFCLNAGLIDPTFPDDLVRLLQTCTRDLSGDAIEFLRNTGQRTTRYLTELTDALPP